MRLTVDLDHAGAFETARVWNALKRYGDGKPYGRVSSSGEGVHLKVHGFDGDPSPVRRRLGCDPMAVEYDERDRPDPEQIMFTSKNGEKAGEWVDTLNGLLEQMKEAKQ